MFQVLWRRAVLACLVAMPGAGWAAQAAPPSVAAVFSPPYQQQLLMQIEVALARVQARHGIIPQAAADEIARTANLEAVPPAAVAERRKKVGHPMVALIDTWADATRDGAGEWIHYGATTQDIYDTAQVMQLRQAVAIMIQQMRQAEEAMLALARQHRDTPMIGRTVGRHALPITFGLKVSSWLAENRRNIERLKSWHARTNTGMLSGAVGSYAALGDQAFQIEAEVMRELGLGQPWPADWKGSKDMFAEYGALLAISAKTWGRIGQEVFILQGDDIRELEDPSDSVGSSTMPHKVNPSYSRSVVQYSRVVPHEAEILLDWMISIHERDQISNADVLGQVSVSMDKLLKAAVPMVQKLRVFPANMRRNLDRTNGLIMAEHAMFVLGQKVGKHTAHEEVRLAAREAWDNGTTLLEAIRRRPALAPHVDELDLASQLDPARYTGLSAQATDRAVAEIERARKADYPDSPAR
ncbi:MAG: adenylosuccinate lyase family protein [Pigmentiphaga sp.]|uniref:class-II fumarase/aspartase family protein n=1 Tax=Pigmentiphaga sp. TaxID=1977564 RepID=UPI0029AC1AE7|nr:adenylosuccinate lyase family protein [Pigmentiphaga sp.]MDX3904557.1 adenylosuccinate lyase family protein [Pigmentiphaga sp.]